MKKVFFILAFMFTFVMANAQVVNKTQITIPSGNTYISYTAIATDSLGVTQDSILFPVLINNDKLYKVTIGATFHATSTSDTIVKIAIWGKNFADEDYTYITSENTAVITSTTVATQKTIAYGTALQYRYLRIHLMRPPSTMTVVTKKGSHLVKLEAKIWEQ